MSDQYLSFFESLSLRTYTGFGISLFFGHGFFEHTVLGQIVSDVFHFTIKTELKLLLHVANR